MAAGSLTANSKPCVSPFASVTMATAWIGSSEGSSLESFHTRRRRSGCRAEEDKRRYDGEEGRAHHRPRDAITL